MAGRYSYSMDLQARTTQFEQNLLRAADKARKLSENTQKATQDIAKLSEGAGKGGDAVGKMGEETGKTGEKMGHVMGTIGSAMGGVKGEVVSLVAELATVTGPLALIVAGIEGIALAWKTSEENVKSYLERVEKGKMDPAIFNRSSKEALKDTKGAAWGGIEEGIRLQDDAALKLSKFGANFTDEQRKQLELQKKLGAEMVKDNSELLKSLGYDQLGLKSREDRLGWIQTYNELQHQNDELDKEKIRNLTEINDLEAGLTEIKTKIFQAGDEKEKEKLLQEYDKKALEIQNKKLNLLDKEKGIKEKMLKMTGKTEELETLLLMTEQEKASAQRGYSMDKFNMQRLINKVSGKPSDNPLKDYMSQSADGYKLGATNILHNNGPADERAGAANTGFLLKNIGKFGKPLISPADLTNLRKYNGLNKEAINNIIKMNNELEKEQLIADELGSVFMDLAMSIEGGFDEMTKSLIHNIEKIALQLAGKAALFTLMKILFPEGAIAAGGIKAFLGLPKFAEGGIISGPTVGMMGEYPGAKSNPEVVAPLSKLQGMLQPAGMNGEVVFTIGERELRGVLVRSNRIQRNIRGRG